MSDVPPRPRIRPATSDDWQKDQSDRAGLTSSPGQESTQSAADFDNSTYYEYLEKHTGDVPVSKNRSRNAFAPAGASAFQGQPQSSSGAPAARQGQPDGHSAHSPQVEQGSDGHASGQIPLQPAPAPKKGNGAKIIVVIVAIIMVLALLAFFGIRWLAPSTGTVPVDFGADESASPSASPSESMVQPTSSSQEALSTYTKQGTAKADDLEGQWVTQVSAKDVGIEADGKTWSAQDIVDEFETNRVKYPGAILIHSGDWDSYKDDNYWVTVIDTPYSDPEPALDQCRSWGLDRDHCLAKRLVKDGSPTDNSAYLDK
ncbi:protein kinase [Brevibacterium zhoupengii]|uniref:protein kinase n=1 Tax=Brevibacterium zhoupengii TaxID=2898795 RepID=UPI001E2EC482|nr:protein kinase [Brevibacterium zhoupengii]